MQLPEVDLLIDRLAEATRKLLHVRGVDDPGIVGIHSGGAWIAEKLRERLGLEEPIGTLDISFYRDDFERAGLHPRVKPSQLPWDVDGRRLLLVDDILYTGRTVRAALNELFDYGRPANVMLAVLVSRSGRELPVQADLSGCELALDGNQHVKLRGPDPLRLELIQTDDNDD